MLNNNLIKKWLKLVLNFLEGNYNREPMEM